MGLSPYYQGSDDVTLPSYQSINIPEDMQITYRIESQEMRDMYRNYHGEPIEVGVEDDTYGFMRFKVIIRQIAISSGSDGYEYMRVLVTRIGGNG